MPPANPQTKILIVDDEAPIREEMRPALESAGYRVLEADSVQTALALARKELPDLIVLDVGLPDGNGLDGCRGVRENKALQATPIIMITGQYKDFQSKFAGITSGADQYLSKPVAPRELLLWVQALLRRLTLDKSSGDSLIVGELVIDLDAHLVRFRDQTVAGLTGKEFDLLYFLVQQRPKVMSRKQILSKLWRTITVDHVVDTHVTNLRKKLPAEISDRIQNVRGKGFRYLA